MSSEFNRSLATRRSLLNRLKNWQDQRSWHEFFDTYWNLIYSMAIKSGLKDAEAQDVVQETLLSVAKRMPNFQYDPAIGSFKNWLMKVVTSRIKDQFRKRNRADAGRRVLEDDTAGTAAIERIPDPAGIELEAVWDEEWKKCRQEALLGRIKRKVKSATHYQIFDLVGLRGWTPEEVAKTMGVTVDLVYKVKSRIMTLIEEEAARMDSSGL